MPKTINYELAKKLYDAGVRIESHKQWNRIWYIPWNGKIHYESDFGLVSELEERDYDEWGNESYPAPNCEEVIEFLPAHYIKKTVFIDDNWIIQLNWYEIFIWEWKTNMSKQLIFSLEKALEYLFDNWYIWTEKK